MHYNVDYTALSPQEGDDKALADMREYLAPKQWEALQLLGMDVNAGKSPFEALCFGFSMVGVSGRPFNAFCRRYCLQAFLTWMRSEPDAQSVDDQGFHIVAEATEVE